MEAGAALKRLLGGLLLATGALIVLTGGLCGGFGVLWAIVYWRASSSEWEVLLQSIGVSVVTITIGTGLFRWGRSLLSEPTPGPMRDDAGRSDRS